MIGYLLNVKIIIDNTEYSVTGATVNLTSEYGRSPTIEVSGCVSLIRDLFPKKFDDESKDNDPINCVRVIRCK